MCVYVEERLGEWSKGERVKKDCVESETRNWVNGLREEWMCMKGETDAVKERFVIQKRVYFSWENREGMSA